MVSNNGIGSSSFATYLPNTKWPYLQVQVAACTLQLYSVFSALVILQIRKTPLKPETIWNLLADKPGSFLWKYSKLLCFQSPCFVSIRRKTTEVFTGGSGKDS